MYYGEFLKVKGMPDDLKKRAKIVQACVDEIKAQINADCDDADWSTMEVIVKGPEDQLNPFNSEIGDDGELMPVWTVGVKVKPYEKRYPESDMPDHSEEP